MRELRVGTRGSDLALIQTRWVCQRLRAHDPTLVIREVLISTHGDLRPDAPIDDDWPMGGFVGAIEQALLEGRIDVAVHSFKDLPSSSTEGLAIAAVPERAVVNDVLVLREPVGLSSVPQGYRIGTSSPRRAAQWRRFARVEIVSIRGNVPTRLARMERESLDGVVLAAAGLNRLSIEPPHMLELPLGEFLPAPAQGALAVQVREGDDAVVAVVSRVDHGPSRLRVEAERALLAVVGPGCHTPVAALAWLADERSAITMNPSHIKVCDASDLEHEAESGHCVLCLRGQLFADASGGRMVERTERVSVGALADVSDSVDAARGLGQALGQWLVDELRRKD